MGEKNSKIECNKENLSNRNQESGRQSHCTAEDVVKILETQKRLYNERLLAEQSRIYPNIQSELTYSPSTSNSYNITPTAPAEILLYTTDTQTMGAASQIIPLREQQPTQRHEYPTSGPSTSTLDSQESNKQRHNSRPNQRAASSLRQHEYPTPGPSTSTLVSQESNKQRRNSRPNQRAASSLQQTNRRAIVNCVTCKEKFGLNIYQCQNGHSSCEDCKSKMKNCGTCCEIITNMRNITLEATFASNIVDDKPKKPCIYKSRGCILHFQMDDMEAHLTDCIFRDLPCPLTNLNDACNWKGWMKNILEHLHDMHPEKCQAEVNKEMSLLLSGLDYKGFHLITLGNIPFILHIQIDITLNNISMAVLCLGTKMQASKWIYELHVYQKKTPRRKFEYIDICQPYGTPICDIITACNCAIINIDYAKTFLDAGKLTYKVYIKKKNINQ
ncbi:E3 ubiquitin-protein ligase siah2-like isoform X4 [Danaus plexippus]|uniref:E3 ubiquitin-protein ligase siah2-like isoform X4 n=1 Tax=Danaus plexippus TaxID=13037 RepID=UPI002AB1A00F|nr:E3 ubiquitin-protein ligase siah2-like isoform X4 [Danaus plexippus]